MTNAELNERIVECLCHEFQTVWFVNTKDLSMHVYKAAYEDSISLCVNKASEFNSYEDTRLWYIDNYVIQQDRARLLEQTSIDVVYSKLSDGTPYYVEYNRICNGIINYNQIFYAPINEGDNKMSYFVLGFRDIDVRKKAEHDELTGLYTKQAFFQKSSELLQRFPEEQFDLMLSDIEDFKNINETYGIEGGDRILSWIGSFLAPCISDMVIVARYSGDQFAVMTTHEMMQSINSQESAQQFIDAEANNGLPHIAIKYGVYEDIKKENSIISACDKAYIALDSIKHQYGRSLAIYGDALRKELEKNRKIEGSMHQALKEEQFKVYYQPKHDAVTGNLIGAEALIRWIHPEYGFMSPADFIPLFEKNGFIVESDFYVWKRTCKNIREWQKKGIKTVPISVNASKLTFEREDLLKILHSAVNENQISPDCLHLEITETLMTENVEALVRKLTVIRAVGYQVELDDFGSGYSSINILSTLPLDVIKLDMSFMKQFGDEKRSKVLAACIKLAKELGYKTVSEGVELKEQCDMLSILGVDAIQGYYYSKPLPEAEFEEYLAQQMQ